MIRRKSSQFRRLKRRSELDQHSELRREHEKDHEKDLSSLDESAKRMGTGVRTESGTVASVDVNEDPAANLFPVRTGQSGLLMNVYKRAPRQGAVCFPGCLGEEAGLNCLSIRS